MQDKRSLSALAAMAVSVAILLVLTIVFVVLFAQCNGIGQGPGTGDWRRNCESESGKDIYQHNAVTSDSAVCSTIGDHVMNVLGGNAMDAGVATVLCVGVSNFHSAGIGGGSFLIYYDSASKSASAFNYRESAPAAANRDMFNAGPLNASLVGGRAIAVPGEIAGLAEAHAAHGRLPWREVVQPVVRLLRTGQRVTRPLASAMASEFDRVPDAAPYASLKRWMVNPATGRVYQPGELMVEERLAHTMEQIAADRFAFYNGSLADEIVREVQAAEGILTKNDLINYRPRRPEPIKVSLASKGLTLYSLPPPSSGAVLAFILGILDGYAGSAAEARTTEAGYVRFLHRIVEAFKFGYAKRSGLGDAEFVDVAALVANMTSAQFAEEIRGRITDHATHNVNYYGPAFDWKEDSGTTHVSLIDSEGNAVAVTSTINTYFGSYVRGNLTGIIYNNEMDDFSIPNRTNYFGLPPSPTNYIAAGKRPMSSMAPVILVDAASGQVRFVSGASGGTRITTGIAYTLARQLYLNETVKKAVDSYRLHHQLVPNAIRYNPAFCDLPEPIKAGLERIGHRVQKYASASVVEALQRLPNGLLQANADFRKPSKTGGF